MKKKHKIKQYYPAALRKNVSYNDRLMSNRDFIDTLILKEGFIHLKKYEVKRGISYKIQNDEGRSFIFIAKAEKEYIDLLFKKVKVGAEVELEHKGTIETIKKPGINTKDAVALIAADHIAENKNYYDKLDEAKLEQGGPVQQLSKGTILEGPSHDNGGIKIQVNNKPVAEAEGGEVVINKNSSKLFCEELSEINQKGGGKALDCNTCEHNQTCEHSKVMQNGGKIDLPIDIDVEEMGKGGLINRRMKFPKTYKAQEGKYGISKAEKTETKSDYEINKEIEKLIDTRGTNPDDYTFDEKVYLRQYSGYGGIEVEKFASQEEAKRALSEFYTPDTIIRKMWALAYKYGFKDGQSILEPSVGTGEFLKYVPTNSMATGYEINRYSYSICKILYPQFQFYLQPFENIFIRNRDSIKSKVSDLIKYDLVIGNPPYGDVSGLGMGMGEKQYSQAKNWVEYFIFRSLDLLNPGGLLIFIIGTEVANGGIPFLQQGISKIKSSIAMKCELLDAYRLPNGVFDRTDVLSDIIVLKRK